MQNDLLSSHHNISADVNNLHTDAASRQNYIRTHNILQLTWEAGINWNMPNKYIYYYNNTTINGLLK